MKNVFCRIVSAIAVFAAAACSSEVSDHSTRAGRILSEIKDPGSEYVVVISHRGDWRNYPENSIPAIESAIRMGVDIMELDVKMTRDSVLVLCHDQTIDRTTNGKGYVRDIDYDSLMTFRLKRSHGVTTDTLRMPTLRQALLCCKDRVLVNVDHAYPYYKEIVELTEELGVTGQVLMKGKSPVDKVEEDMSHFTSNLLYMPVIDINRPSGKALFAEYQDRGIVPLAYEVCWQNADEDLAECIDRILQTGSKLWVNTIWASLCGGYGNDDDAAFEAADPAAVYGQYMEMGVSMIQTDRPELLIGYLRSIGRHD